MRALVINSKEKKVEVVEISETDSLSEMQALVGGYIQGVLKIGKQDQLYVDEEGQMKSHTTGFYVTGSPHPVYVGNGVILGFNRKGDEIDCTLTAEYVRSLVVFLQTRETH